MLQGQITYYNLKYSYIPSMSMHMRHHSSRVPNLNLRYIMSNSAQPSLQTQQANIANMAHG